MKMRTTKSTRRSCACVKRVSTEASQARSEHLRGPCAHIACSSLQSCLAVSEPLTSGLPFPSAPSPHPIRSELRVGSLTLVLKARSQESTRRAPHPASHNLLCSGEHGAFAPRHMLSVASASCCWSRTIYELTSPSLCLRTSRRPPTSRSRRHFLCFRCQLFLKCAPDEAQRLCAFPDDEQHKYTIASVPSA